MPTAAEIIAALEAFYAAEETRPRTSDVVNLTLAGNFNCRAHVTATDPRPGAADRESAVAFNVDEITYYAMIYGTSPAPRILDGTLSAAGAVPTVSEMQSAAESAYAETDPVEGDRIVISDGEPKFIAFVSTTGSGGPETLFNFSFTAGGDTWYACAVQCGIW